MTRLLHKVGGAEVASIVICMLAFAVPFVTQDRFAYSIFNQILIAVVAAFSVYIMLRMNLILFAVPAFMAIGGYASALLALNGVTNAIVLVAVSFGAPALVAVPLGVLILRLRGVYFVLVTFVFAEIMQLLLFELPGLTGGSNGLAGVPAATLFDISLASYASVLLLATVVALLATLITAAVTRFFRQHFAAIEENEVLAQSLGLVVWRYKAIGFVIAAGLAGMAGFSLVSMLLTAHPSSFSGLSGVNYITYALVGGRASILGPIVGSTLLVWASNLFSSQGQYSQGLFGILIILVVVLAKGGIVGTVANLFQRFGPAARRNGPAAMQATAAKEEPSRPSDASKVEAV